MVNPDICRSVSDHHQWCGRLTGQVHNTVPNIGAAVIDPDNHGLAVFQIVHPDPCIEGQGTVGCSELVHIVGLPVCSSFTMEFGTIPAGTPFPNHCEIGRASCRARVWL